MDDSLAYGAWRSPITTELITAGTIRLSQDIGTGGRRFWLEGRPTEDGRYCVVEDTADGPVDRIPAGFNCRTRVHEYGGGAYAVDDSSPDGDGVLVFQNYKDQKLYAVGGAVAGGADTTAADTPRCLTPGDDHKLRFADLTIDPARRAVLAVVEDHGGGPKPSDVRNYVARVALDGSGAIATLAAGRDFYSNPRLSPDGVTVAFVAWDHPNMPWDDTELWLAPASGDPGDGGGDGGARRVAGGGRESIMMPTWSPDGTALFFISDRTDWWNVYRMDVATGAVEAVYPLAAEVGSPQWVFRMSSRYCFVGSRHLALAFRASGQQRLALLDLGAGTAVEAPLPFGPPGEDPRCAYVEHEDLPAGIASVNAAGAELVVLGGGPAQANAVFRVRLQGGTLDGGGGSGGGGGSAAITAEVSMLRRSFDASSMGVDLGGFISAPEEVEFPTTLADGTAATAFAYVYAPTNKDAAAAGGALPPLLVKIHGGPTSCARTALRLDIQYWTSRGFCVADVNYGGSTGYGRNYRERLLGSWGVVDVNDVCAVAEHLAAAGRVDRARLAIDGGSAGGYTTLAALCFHDVFSAGCSLYGVSDLAALAEETHKFESRYLDKLVAPYPEGKAVYDARSPIQHVDGLDKPILILQGDEDKIVPLNQAEMMHDAVKAKGVRTCMIVFEGEQHGFRKAENISRALEAELLFYGKVFGFEPADEIAPLQIDNDDEAPSSS